MPDVPTAAESGLKGFDVVSWMGLLAPANTPIAILERLAGDKNMNARTAVARNPNTPMAL